MKKPFWYLVSDAFGRSVITVSNNLATGIRISRVRRQDPFLGLQNSSKSCRYELYFDIKVEVPTT
jgi:hypothetical protein